MELLQRREGTVKLAVRDPGVSLGPRVLDGDQPASSVQILHAGHFHTAQKGKLSRLGMSFSNADCREALVP